MAKYTRKELKRDEIREELAGSVGYVYKHRNKVIIAAILAVVIGAGLAFYVGQRRTQRLEAEKALQAAVDLYHGEVDTEERMGMITFTTSIERYNRTTEALEAVTNEYPGTDQAQRSQYYLALLDIEQGKYQEAQQRLEPVSQSSDEETASIARVALAEVYLALDKDAEAEEQYQYLVDHPTTLVPKARAQLHLARFLTSREPERAREILNELVQQPGVLGGAATTELRQLAGT